MAQQFAFINTEDEPLKIERLGVFSYRRDHSNHQKVYFSEMCEIWYPHPQAPEHAKVSVYHWLPVKMKLGTEHLAQQCVDAMMGLQKISELKVE